MSKTKPSWNPIRMAEATSDAYSADGYTSWEQCCRLLLQRGYSAMEAEAILRSKWTRWARDGWNGKGTPTSRALSDFLKNETKASVAELVSGYVSSDFKYKPELAEMKKGWRRITVECNTTISLLVPDDMSTLDVLSDLDCQVNPGDLAGYQVEDAIIHLDEASPSEQPV